MRRLTTQREQNSSSSSISLFSWPEARRWSATPLTTAVLADALGSGPTRSGRAHLTSLGAKMRRRASEARAQRRVRRAAAVRDAVRAEQPNSELVAHIAGVSALREVGV